jgi:hypothetical protein
VGIEIAGSYFAWAPIIAIATVVSSAPVFRTSKVGSWEEVYMPALQRGM